MKRVKSKEDLLKYFEEVGATKDFSGDWHHADWKYCFISASMFDFCGTVPDSYWFWEDCWLEDIDEEEKDNMTLEQKVDRILELLEQNPTEEGAEKEEKANTEKKQYEVKTPIDIDGDILISDKKQVLYTSNNGYSIYTLRESKDCSDNFVWVPCAREDLKTGDTAYCRDYADDFSVRDQVCKVIDDKWVVYESIHDDQPFSDIIVSDMAYENWYKLVRK